MFHPLSRLLVVALVLCISHAVCEGQIIQGKPAPPDTSQTEDPDGYPDPPPAPTKQQLKHAAVAQNAVINYLGSPPRPTHYSTKLAYYLASTVSSRNVIEAALMAGIPDLQTAPTQPSIPAILDGATGPAYEAAFQKYGDQMDVWRRTSEAELRYRGNRAGVGLATSETRMLLSNLLLPITFRQTGRYEAADINTTSGSRLGHAFASIAVARNDRGTLVPNYSKIMGTAGAALVGRFYYASAFAVKGLDRNRLIGKYIGCSLAGDLATNVSRELVRIAVRPDIMRADEAGPSLQDAYYPLTFAGKVIHWTRSTYEPRNFISGGLIAGIPTMPAQPVYPAAPTIDSLDAELAYDGQLTQYGAAEQAWRDNLEQDIRYHGRRFIGGVSESETQAALSELILPAALRMEPRYIPLGSGHGVGARMANAFAGLVITHMDSGRRVPNVPLLGGTAGAALIAREYYYPQLGVAPLASSQALEKTIGYNLAGDLLLHIVTEFFPRRSF